MCEINPITSCRLSDPGQILKFLLRRSRDKDEAPVHGRKHGKSANSKGQVGREVEGVAPRGKAVRKGWDDLPIRNAFTQSIGVSVDSGWSPTTDRIYQHAPAIKPS